MSATVPQTTLLRANLTVSRIGLGLAHLHTMASAAACNQLMGRALELGITHFDTARFYGDGYSERTLGAWLGARRKAVTITTKFGLLPVPLIGSLGPLAPVARKGRSLLRRLKLVSHQTRSYTRRTLEVSLAASLKALRTDYIDLYLIHEPLACSEIGEELIEVLERKRSAGVVRSIGVAGSTIDAVVERFGGRLDIIQSGEQDWREPRFVPDITHSVFSGGKPVEGRHLSARSARGMLLQALARRARGAVIVQTGSVEHLEQIAAWAGEG